MTFGVVLFMHKEKRQREMLLGGGRERERE